VTGQRRSVVLVEQFYWPEGWGGAQLPRDLSVALVAEGWNVEVLCGADQYASIAGDGSYDPRKSGVRIRRVPRVISGLIHRLKLLRQLWFYFAAVPMLVFGRRPDIYVAQTNPPLVVPIVACIARARRRPYLIIAQDIYPEIMFAHGMSQRDGLLGRLLVRIFASAYRHAERVVALGAVMAARLNSKGVLPERIEVISNWATGDVRVDRGDGNKLRDEWGLAGCFVILYSGNIGIAHDVETPITALRMLLEKSSQARLVFVGNGSRLADARHAAAEARVSHAVQFRALVTGDRLPQTLGLAQIALVTLRDGFEGLVVPSKLLGYMARGIPTLYVGPHSDVEQMLVESGGGICVRNGDAQAACSRLRELMSRAEDLASMGAAAERYYQDNLSQERALRKYVKLFDSVLPDLARNDTNGKGSYNRC
jgi:putative colanic acid biosynthesis glycosyltransferase WcaI